MPIRNRHLVGDYLMTSDLSGRTFPASEMVKQWDGAWVHTSEYEPRNPQDFVRAIREEQPKEIRSQQYDTVMYNGGAVGIFIGRTTVPVSQLGPAWHLYDFDLAGDVDNGVGDMSISGPGVGGSFIIRMDKP